MFQSRESAKYLVTTLLLLISKQGRSSKTLHYSIILSLHWVTDHISFGMVLGFYLIRVNLNCAWAIFKDLDLTQEPVVFKRMIQSTTRAKVSKQHLVKKISLEGRRAVTRIRSKMQTTWQLSQKIHDLLLVASVSTVSDTFYLCCRITV